MTNFSSHRFVLWLLLGAGCVLSCATRSPPSLSTAPQSVGYELVAMGTVWSFKIPATNFDETSWWEVKDRSQRILEQYDSVFSSWRRDSEVKRLDRLVRNGSVEQYRSKKASELFLEGLEFAEAARSATQGAFDIRAPRGLDFGGLTKGHVLGELAWLFLKAGFQDFSIDGGGGNQVFAGQFRPEGFNARGSLVFRSASRGFQGNKQHIFDRRDPHRKIDSTAVVYCWTLLNKFNGTASTRSDVKQTKLVGSLSDAFSTALLIDRENWGLPNFCQELKTTDLKFL